MQCWRELSACRHNQWQANTAVYCTTRPCCVPEGLLGFALECRLTCVQGTFHRAQLAAAGVQLLADPLAESTTGTVVVLTTGDADRTFLSFLGDGQALALTPGLDAAIGRCRMLVVEGYLWEMPGASEVIGRAICAARRGGAGVALTAGDPGLVARHRGHFWRVLRDGADVLFANRFVSKPDVPVALGFWGVGEKTVLR